MHLRVARAAGRELEVDPTTGHPRGAEGVVGLLEPETDARMVLAERPDQAGHEPAAERDLEGDVDRAGLGVHQLVDGSVAVVERVQQAVDVPLELGAGPGGAQQATVALQQRRADLALETGQRAGHTGLADHVEIGHLRDRHAVRDLLEPAQCLGLHTHDDSAWISCILVIGRMGRARGK